MKDILSSNTETLVIAHLCLRRGVVGFQQATDMPYKSARSCQYWSIQFCRRIYFWKCPCAVWLRSALSRSFVVVGGLFLYWTPPFRPLCDGVLVSTVSARISPSLRIAHDVHVCFCRPPQNTQFVILRDKYGDWKGRRAIQPILTLPVINSFRSLASSF